MSDTDGSGTRGGDAPRWPTLAGSDPAPARRSRRAAGPVDANDPDGRRPATGAHAAVPAPAAAPTTPTTPIAPTTPQGPPASTVPAAPAAPWPGSPAPAAAPFASSVPAASSAAQGDGPADPASGTPDAPTPSGGGSGRRRALIIGGIVAAVLVAGGVTAFLLTRDGAAPAAEAPPAVVLPSPTSTVAPAARPATTPFASALPTTVLQYALAASADDEGWLAQNAVEAYTESYTDGGSATVEVQAGQWETPEEATAVAGTLTAALSAAGTAPEGTETTGTETAASGTPTVLLQDDVLVGGQATGTVTVLDLGDGTGVAVWNNGTTVFRLTGPAADIENLYAAYPL